MLNFLTSGESHGQALSAIIEGLPANLKIDINFINKELGRRQLGFGRGARMKIEKDVVRILSGVRDSYTIASPINFIIENKDWPNWSTKMDANKAVIDDILTKPRPGHADLSGVLKTGLKDIRNILERSSARQTAPLVGVGAFAKTFLNEFDVKLFSYVTATGSVEAADIDVDYSMLRAIDESPVRTADKSVELKMIKEIEKAQKAGDTLGGSFQVVASGVVPGLGGYGLPSSRLDGKLCAALVSIPAIKGVAIGNITETAFLPGSQAHDEIFYTESRGYYRKTNKAGGIEGGMSNGNDIIVNGLMKPIPTLTKPLSTVEMESKETTKAFNERHDTVAVAAAAVIAEAAVAIELASAYLLKFGSDNIEDIKNNYQSYLNRIKKM